MSLNEFINYALWCRNLHKKSAFVGQITVLKSGKYDLFFCSSIYFGENCAISTWFQTITTTLHKDIQASQVTEANSSTVE